MRRTRDDHLKWSSRVIGAQPDRERGSASSPQNHSALRGALHAIAAATALPSDCTMRGERRRGCGDGVHTTQTRVCGLKSSRDVRETRDS